MLPHIDSPTVFPDLDTIDGGRFLLLCFFHEILQAERKLSFVKLYHLACSGPMRWGSATCCVSLAILCGQAIRRMLGR